MYVEPRGQPCPDVRSGGDLPAFDFISKFALDRGVTDTTGIRKVPGTNNQQTAYRLSPPARLRERTRNVFPDGFPSLYSFRATFRPRNGALKDNWNLVTVYDPFQNPQFGVGLRPRQREVVFFINDYTGQPQYLTFPATEVRFIIVKQYF